MRRLIGDTLSFPFYAMSYRDVIPPDDGDGDDQQDDGQQQHQLRHQLRQSRRSHSVQFHSVKRKLFSDEPIDHEQTKRDLERELKEQQLKDMIKYNFDFVNEQPLNDSPDARYEWSHAIGDMQHDIKSNTNTNTNPNETTSNTTSIKTIDNQNEKSGQNDCGPNKTTSNKMKQTTIPGEQYLTFTCYIVSN